MKFPYVYVILLLLLGGQANAQKSAQELAEKITSFQENMTDEMVYLSYDKPAYTAGDTIWYKAFLLHPNGLPGSSIRMYVELIDSKNKLSERYVIPLTQGTGSGYIPLRANIPEGNYAIRAYTNIQQNRGPEHFYVKTFSLGQVNDKTWVVGAKQDVKSTASGYQVNLNVQLSNLKNELIGLKPVEVTLMNGTKSIIRTNLQTDERGFINPEFPVPANLAAADLYLMVADRSDRSKNIQFPIRLPVSQNIDLQFFPEGGYLVAGQPAIVGFKAIDRQGFGISISGEILNSKNEKITEFADSHKGMGSFQLLPQAGESFTAVVVQSDGSQKRYPLPAVMPNGTTLKISKNLSDHSVFISVRATEDRRFPENYYLVAQQNKRLLFAIDVPLKNGFFNLKLFEKDLPKGIVQFTLFSPESVALNQRSVVTRLPEVISIENLSKGIKIKRGDSVQLNLNFSWLEKPATGSYAASVTDNAQVSLSSNAGNLRTHMFFGSDIAGWVEDPNWYFQNADSSATALDNLMLTQGWKSYDWSAVFEPVKPLAFKAETDQALRGKISNLFKGAMPNLSVSLLSVGKNLYLDQTTSDTSGRFIFYDLPVVDTAAYVVKLKNAKGKASASTINFDEFTPAPLVPIPFQNETPWYVNPNPILLNYAKTQESQMNASLVKSNTIKQVDISSKKILPRSAGMLWSSVLKAEIDEEELIKTPKLSLYDLLRAKLPEFGKSRLFIVENKPIPNREERYTMGLYRIADVTIDGISTKVPAGIISNTSLMDNAEEDTNTADFQSYNQNLFNYIAAAEIKNIKYYKSPSYAFLVIQTRSGKGPFLQVSPGLGIFRPLPNQLPTKYYQPKYIPGAFDALSERATVYWDPFLEPNQEGRARLSFLAPTKPGLYTLRIEGSNFAGQYGVFSEKFIVE